MDNKAMVLNKVYLRGFARILFLALLLGTKTSLHAQKEPVKHAIIIANSIYEPETGWRKLGAANDITVMHEALLERGFSNENIHVFEQQTKVQMQSVLQKYLVDNVSEGDIVYFQFSGHGQQIATLTPSLEQDGLDEALVPVDAPSGNKVIQNSIEVAYDYSKHFRDKELKAILQASSKKLGEKGSIFVVIDACHSGGATRSVSKLPPHRGANKPNVPEGWSAPTLPTLPTLPTFELHNTAEVKGAPIAVFSASGAHELNFEHALNDTTTVGSLSFALAQSLLNVPSNASYQQLFDEVIIHMGRIANRQNPQAEGILNQEVFGGKMLPFAVYAKVEKIDYYNNSVLINWGQLHEVFEGAEVGFFEPGTLKENIKSSTPIAIGKVTESGPLKAQITLHQTADSSLEKAWVYITKKTYGDLSVSVMVEANKPKEKKFISAFLQKSSPVVVNDTQADFLLKTTAREISLFDINNQPVYSVPMPPKKQYKERLPLLLDTIKSKLESFARAKYIVGLNEVNNNYRGDILFEVYRKKPAFLNDSISSLFNKYESETSNGTLEGFFHTYFNKREQLLDTLTQLITVAVEDVYFLKLKNTGNAEAYFSVLAIDPNYKIDQLYPDTSATLQSENKLRKNRILPIDKIFLQQEPLGNQIFKLILSNDFRNFTTVVYGSEKTALEDDDELLQLLNEAFSTQDVATRSSLSTTSGVGIYTFVIKVVPKETTAN